MEVSARGKEASFSVDIGISPADEPVVVDGPPPGKIVDGGTVDFNDVVARS